MLSISAIVQDYRASEQWTTSGSHRYKVEGDSMQNLLRKNCYLPW